MADPQQVRQFTVLVRENLIITARFTRRDAFGIEYIGYPNGSADQNGNHLLQA